tara:strand:+ start:168 stop:416 length:249 start_codon:yes stop_codon:yes gene_type:complete
MKLKHWLGISPLCIEPSLSASRSDCVTPPRHASIAWGYGFIGTSVDPAGHREKHICDRDLQIIGARRAVDGIIAIAMCALTV